MANEISALAEVAADVADRVVLRTTQTLHTAIAGRAFAANGIMARPVQVTHDAVTSAVYGGLRAGLRRGGAFAARAGRAAAAGRDVGPLSAGRAGRLMLSAVNGVIGDRLVELHSDLSVAMAVRQAGVEVAPHPAALARAFPRATPRLAIFVHGLCETDESWRPTMRVRVRRECGVTAVHVRYNTGLHVATNGAQLAALVEQVVAAWPVPVDDVALVGHSMGGLVVRAAGQTALDQGMRWPSLTRNLVTLGTPHQGSYVEQGAHRAASRMRALPEARALADIIDLRSAGIRDLRHGYVRESEWREDLPGPPLPLLAGCTHTFVVARLTRSSRHPLGRLVGDLLVRTDSARGRHSERSIPISEASIIELGGLHHFDLLGHPLVCDVLCDVLGGARPAARTGTR